jgi:hypothetical protein
VCLPLRVCPDTLGEHEYTLGEHTGSPLRTQKFITFAPGKNSNMERNKQKIIERVDAIIKNLESLNIFQQDNGIYTIIKKYAQVHVMLDSNNLFTNNPIKGSVRAYLDIFSDYENPLLAEMYSIEKEIDLYIVTCQKGKH